MARYRVVWRGLVRRTGSLKREPHGTGAPPIAVLAALASMLLGLGHCAAPGKEPSQSRAIKIATQSPLTGPQAWGGEAITVGAQLAVEKFKGPLESAGFVVEVAHFDDQATPDVGVANARKLVADPDVLLVIGHLNSSVVLPASDLYRDADLAMIFPTNTNIRITDRAYPNVNRVLGRDDVQGRVAAQFAREDLRATTAFVVHDRTEYGQGGAEVFREVAGRIGLTLAGYEGFPGYERTQAPDFGAIIRRMAASQPDVVYFGGIYDQAAILFKQARAQGVRAAFLGPDGLDSADLVKLAGQAVVGLHYVTQAGPIESYPEAREFAKEFQRRFGKQAGAYVVEAYDATLVGLRAIELALERTGGRRPTRKEVCEAIRRLPDIQGLTGSISFDARGDRRLARYFVLRVESPNPAMWDHNRLVQTIEAPSPLSRR